MSQSHAANPIGTTVAERYEIIRALGHGAFGHTFLARDRVAERDVAVKVLDPRDRNVDLKARELFERECAVLRGMRHHGIPEVYDVLRQPWEGTLASFLVMEYVEGTSLARMIEEQQRLDPVEIVRLFLEMLGILEYLHDRVPPVLHRDIKPANVIVRVNGMPALVDFGSVRNVMLGPDDAGSTVAGTYGYMPYEQYMGQAVPASDLYALAATFLHVITGRPPREFMTPEGRIEVPGELPGQTQLQPVLARLLRPSPAERFSGARQVRQALMGAMLSGGGALVPVRRESPRSMVRSVVDVAALGEAPRALEGEAAALVDRVAYRMSDLLDTGSKRGDKPGFLDWAIIIVFSTLTVGTIPLIFYSIARARRRRVIRFVRDGTPGIAEVTAIELEPSAFGEKMARVNYQFEAGGSLHRDADRVVPNVAHRWLPGDSIQILYLPEEDYDSIIISTG